MIQIFTHNDSARLSYTLEVFFGRILKVPYEIVTDKTKLDIKKFPVINYSSVLIPDAIQMQPHTLLFDTDIKSQDIAVTHQKDIPFFFKTSDKAEIIFDVFASSFYMLSRYEEYLPFKADEHGRFPAKESLAYKANFIDKPVVQLWVYYVAEKIQSKHPDFKFQKPDYQHLSTIDVDVAYAFKGKSFVRRSLGYSRAIATKNKELIKLYKYYLDTKKDPYDTYAYLKKLQDQNQSKWLYFFQIGQRGYYDKNLPLSEMCPLIESIAEYADVGLHPSYQSNSKPDLVANEVKALESCLGRPLTKSRQHYLKLTFPKTYESLISAGIEEDYTLGFSDHIGFRAGIAIPFPFFNLSKNEKRPLQIVPFQIMEGTLKDYMKLDVEEALIKIKNIKKTIQKTGGTLVSIFHNSSVNGLFEMKGWNTILDILLEQS